jgi:hypothetical protein
MCKTLGPSTIAGITISPHGTLLRPTNLLPDTLLHHPGLKKKNLRRGSQIVLGKLTVMNFHLCPEPTNPCQILAAIIDVTITGWQSSARNSQHPSKLALQPTNLLFIRPIFKASMTMTNNLPSVSLA